MATKGILEQLDDYIRGLDAEAHRLDADGDGFRNAGNQQKASYYYGCSSAFRDIIGSLSLLVATFRAENGIPVDQSWRDQIQYDDDDDDGQDPLKRGDFDED